MKEQDITTTVNNYYDIVPSHVFISGSPENPLPLREWDEW